MITPPILCIEGQDIIVFDSVADAESFIEPADAKSGELFDSEGQLLTSDVGLVEREQQFLLFKWKRTYESTIIRNDKPTVNRSAELRTKLINYLVQKGEEGDLQDIPLKELIHRVRRFMPWSKKHTDIPNRP